MNIQLIKKIGSGVMGEVYLINFNKKKCVLKIEKADPIIDISNNAYSRQIKFDNFVKKSKYKKHLLTLKSYGWFEDCKLKLPVPEWATGDKKNFLQNRNKLNTCYFLIYEPVLEYPLYVATEKAKTYSKICKIINKCVQQLLPVIINLHENGFTHNDIHQGNIMYGNNRWYLIDYGLLKHKSWKQIKKIKEKVKKVKNKINDYLSLINISIYSPIKELGYGKKKFKLMIFKSNKKYKNLCIFRDKK